jgi:colanic acid/amylovoran biosynthesis glycosyltransferase
LTVGRLVEKKGLEYAVRAVALARRTCPNLRYEIIGDGPLRPALGELVDKLNLAPIVSLLGAADCDFVRRKMAATDLFMLPSVTANDGDQEGIPVSLMEAQACGLPVLSTRHSGIPELVADGESGFLVAERDVEALASRLTYLIEHPESWPRMGRAGRTIVESRFNIEALNRDLLQIYEHAILKFHRHFKP